MSHNIVINPLKCIFLIFIIVSCSTLVEDENMNKNNVIYKISSIDSNFSNLETLLFVDINTQSLLLIKKVQFWSNIVYLPLIMVQVVKKTV